MNETSKSKKIWGDLEQRVLQGEGIDIGCGPDPVLPSARRFDMEDGDANVITRHVSRQFDYVYSSHCLEHMHDPESALREWWQLVKVGGHLFFAVPDEDLYEQGVFPSRFNPDHKATFTISKRKSWSPRSYNVLDLARGLPGASIVKIELQDNGYNRRRLNFGPYPSKAIRGLLRIYRNARETLGLRSGDFEYMDERLRFVDQTCLPETLAQIVCILRKEG